jgi:hypothetical protein
MVSVLTNIDRLVLLSRLPSGPPPGRVSSRGMQLARDEQAQAERECQSGRNRD